MRIAVAGGPRTGKTTYGAALAARHRCELVSTDDMMGLPWEAVPDACVDLLRGLEGFVLEGVQAGRVLRRWYSLDPAGPRLDGLVVLSRPLVPWTRGQAAMAKGIDTVLREVIPAAHRHGAQLQLGLPPDAEAPGG